MTSGHSALFNIITSCILIIKAQVVIDHQPLPLFITASTMLYEAVFTLFCKFACAKKHLFAINNAYPVFCAGIAQLVEHPTCNRTVVGSIPTASTFSLLWGCRIVAIARDCKSLDSGLRWFESNRPHLRGSAP